MAATDIGTIQAATRMDACMRVDPHASCASVRLYKPGGIAV
jgi:hypothetical protein